MAGDDSDDQRWARCLAFLPTEDELRFIIATTSARIPRRSDDECALRTQRLGGTAVSVDLMPQQLRDSEWYITPAARRLLEIFASHFVPRLVKSVGQPPVEFEACVGWTFKFRKDADSDDTEASRAAFFAYVQRWVLSLEDDPYFMQPPEGDTHRLRRRAWLAASDMRMAGTTADVGHQLLVVAETTGAGRVTYYVVDNLRTDSYDNARWPLHLLLRHGLALATRALGWTVQTHIVHVNRMGATYPRSCLCRSLRALLACALLERPWPYIAGLDPALRDDRLELFVFAHLERMRFALLAEPKVWSTFAPHAVVFAPGMAGLHRMNTKWLWIVRTPRPDMPTEPFHLRCWLNENDGEDGVERYYFNPDLRAPSAFAAGRKPPHVCCVMAPFN